jgi:integrase
MSRQQSGYIWRVGNSWFGRWREDVLEDGKVVRKQRSAKLADVCERFRTESDVRPLLVEKLRPINEGRTSPESTLSVSDFVEKYYLPFVEENYKPSTLAGYRSTWEMYIASRLEKVILRDFRTVNAAILLADIHRTHNLGRTTLNHIKTLLSGVFTYAKNQGVLDGINPIRDAMIPKKAAAPEETHATTPDEVLSIMAALKEAGEQKARAAVALVFFTGLRPGEARGVCWEDFDGKKLTVRQSVWHTHTTAPKTKSSAKPVPVIEPLQSILVALRESDGDPTSGPILRGPSGKPLDLHNLANRVVIPTLKRCLVCQQSESDHGKADHDYRLNESLPKWYGWYALRRGVATAVTVLSKDSLAAKGLLRHSSVSTTERHYIKNVPSVTLDAMKLLESLCNDNAIEGGGKLAN